MENYALYFIDYNLKQMLYKGGEQKQKEIQQQDIPKAIFRIRFI